MNPMTNVKNISKLSEQELKVGGKSSWHDQYRGSAWIFIGGLPYDLTEGDVICVFSQYGEIVNINLVRDKDSGKQKGYCFICYEDQRSTTLAVDNLNGLKILGRTLRVDHVSDYKAPKEGKKNPLDEQTRLLRNEGCAPLSAITQANVKYGSNVKHESPELSETIIGGVRLPARLPIRPTNSTASKDQSKQKEREKKSKKESKKKKRRKSSSSSSSSSSDDSSNESRFQRKQKKKKKKK